MPDAEDAGDSMVTFMRAMLGDLPPYTDGPYVHTFTPDRGHDDDLPDWLLCPDTELEHIAANWWDENDPEASTGYITPPVYTVERIGGTYPDGTHWLIGEVGVPTEVSRFMPLYTPDDVGEPWSPFGSVPNTTTIVSVTDPDREAKP